MHAPIADQPAAEIVKAAPVERQVKTEALRPCEPATAATAPTAIAPTAVATTTTAERTAAAALPTRAARVARRDEIRVLLIARRERTRRRAAQPQIPIERVGRRSRGRNLRHLLRPTGASRPGVNFFHFADLSRPEYLAGYARRVVRITLVAHLR